MRLGIASPLAHSSAAEWAGKMVSLGCRAVVFPLNHTDNPALIDAYRDEAVKKGLRIAEVGSWVNPLALDETERQKNIDYCVNQLRLADYLKADCCVNICGAAGAVWDGAYKENFSEEFLRKTVKSIQEIIDRANPQYTSYSIEPMPWMMPADPDQYLWLLKEVNRKHFAVHMDLANWITSPQKYLMNEQFIDEVFNKLGEYIRSCHLKDVMLAGEFTLQLKEVACGKGSLNLEYYVKRAKEIDPEIPMIIEHLHTDEEYIESVEYVKARMKKAGLLE
ncbi:MAG: TIM barrel protein [Bacillota bacterium]|nr:TIM barrel protein [Bacillota bacterium]